MNDEIAILDFDEVYKQEKFYKGTSYHWVNLEDIPGSNKYCQEETEQLLRKKLTEINNYKIKFIGSGNYHYVTYLLLEKIEEPFTLVLFDHHTDMIPSRFFDILSCGSWVKRALDTNSNLKQVILIGVKKDLVKSIDPVYEDRVVIFTEPVLEGEDLWEVFCKNNIKYPIYISIDKDVLGRSYASTNWDQGCLTLEQLGCICNTLCRNKKILGMDVCGENTLTYNGINMNKNDIELNDNTNKKILEYADEW